jgi:hypothetical protein
MGATGKKSGPKKGPRARVLTDDTVLLVKMTVRAATGLLRALSEGDPMTGPDVSPLIQELNKLLKSGSNGKNGKGKSGSGRLARSGP